MDTGDFRRVLGIVLATLIVSMNWDSTEAKENPTCQESLHTSIRQRVFKEVGLKLMEMNEDNGKGFVYSPMKLFHKLTTLLALTSKWAEYGIKSYLKLNDDCDVITLCKAFRLIVDDMNSRLTSKTFLFSSWIYYQQDYEVKDLEFCVPTNRYNFLSDPGTVLYGLNQKYGEYGKTTSPYLDHNLNPNSLLFLLDVLKTTPDVFGTINRYKITNPFRDIDNQDRQVSWLRIKGDFLIGKYTDLTKCEYVRTYRIEISDGKFYMLFFRPLPDVFVRDEQITCIKEILSQLGDYIKFTIQKSTLQGRGWSKADSIVFPLLDMSTDVDLKPILERIEPLFPVFKEHQIPGIHDGPQVMSLHELRAWDYFNTKPDKYDQLIPETNLLDSAFLLSPFVFAMVEKKTGMVLKTGTVLRV